MPSLAKNSQLTTAVVLQKRVQGCPPRRSLSRLFKSRHEALSSATLSGPYASWNCVFDHREDDDIDLSRFAVKRAYPKKRSAIERAPLGTCTKVRQSRHALLG